MNEDLIRERDEYIMARLSEIGDPDLQPPKVRLFDQMKRDPKFRSVVKKLAAKGDADYVEAMILWDAHVKRMRRTYASR